MKKNPWPVLVGVLAGWLIYLWIMAVVLAWVVQGPLEEILEKDIRFGALWVLSVMALAFFSGTPTVSMADKTK